MLIYAVLAPLLINTGIADNGDFSRSMQWFIEKPAAFETNWPSDDGTWDRRFAKFWIDEWTPKPEPALGGMESRSSAQLLNMAGIAANAAARTVTGNTGYSLRIASIPARIVELAAFADRLQATPDTRISLSHLRNGRIPQAGGTVDG